MTSAEVTTVRRHRIVLAGVLILAAGAGLVGARSLKSQQHVVGGPGGANVAGSLPTVARPLAWFAKQTTLASAQTALGQAVVLPQSTAVGPSDAGPVWSASLSDPQTGATTTTVAVTFPAQGMIMEYTRPAPSDGSAAHFQAMAQSMPSPSGASEGQVISLSGGVPALAVQQNSDDTGANFGEVIFNVAGTEVRVMGHNDESTLQDLAESVLAQASR
jgi:hypothetical protein